MGADFQPNVHTEFRQRMDRRRELHGLPHASSPVDGAARFARATPAGNGAEKRDRVGLRHEIGECFLEFFGGRLHQRMMEGMIDPDESGEDALRLHLGEHCFERNARAGEGQRTRAIDGGDRDGAVVARDQGTRFVFAQTHREHRAFPAGAAVHETGPLPDDPRAFLQAEHAGNASRGDFSDTMADDRRGLNAPGFPQLRQRDLQGENRRLRDLRAVHLRGLLGASEFFQQGKACPRFHRGGATFKRRSEDRLVAYQLPTHPIPLRALSAHHEGDAWRRFAMRREGRSPLHALLFHPKSVELSNQLGHRFCDDGEAMRMVIAPRSERITEIRQGRGVAIVLRTLIEPLRETQSGSAQRVL